MDMKEFIITTTFIIGGSLVLLSITAAISNKLDKTLPNHKLTCFEGKVYTQKNKDNIHWYPLFLYNGKEYIPIECK